MDKIRLLKLSAMFFIFSVTVFYSINQESNGIQTYQKSPQQDFKNPITSEINFISIVNDNDFTDYGFPGSGSIENPFIIENIVLLSMNYSYGIKVRNTTKHFVIRNCTLTAYYSCIVIEEVSKGTAIIQNNTCLVNTLTECVGIELIKTNGAQIINNNCSTTLGVTIWEPMNGIKLENSKYTLVKNNLCAKQIHNGIYSVHCENNRYEKNKCFYNHGSGITISDSKNETLIENIFYKNQIGAFLSDIQNSFITNNSFTRNSNYGIYLRNTMATTLTENRFEFSGKYGCLTYFAEACLFTYNQFINNSQYGIFLEKHSSRNSIHHNRFIYNNIGGGSQVLDHGANNIWYEEQTEEGNFWSDYSGRGKYKIDGYANSEDPYPLNSVLEKIGVNFFIFMTTIIIVVVLRRKKQNIV